MRKLIKENKVVWPMSDNITPDQYYINQLLDKLDTKACEVESRWGVGRLERLVSFEMAQKWKRQMDRLNAAISKNDAFVLPDIVTGTIKGYEAMEADAIAQGNKPHDAPLMWTVGFADGKTLAIVRHEKDKMLAKDFQKDWGDVVVWSLDEIANIIEKEYTLVNQPSVKNAGVPKPEVKPFDFIVGDTLPEEFK